MATVAETSFDSFFALYCLRRASESWTDYEKGKDLIRGFYPDEYEEGINALKAYLWL